MDVSDQQRQRLRMSLAGYGYVSWEVVAPSDLVSTENTCTIAGRYTFIALRCALVRYRRVQVPHSAYR
jgi:hypothetical protein